MDFIFFILIGVVVIVFFLGWFFRRDARIRRAIKKLPVTKVKDFADGTIGRVVGQVRVIEEGETVAVCGRGRIERQAGSPRGQLVIGPNNEEPVLISDHPSTCKP